MACATSSLILFSGFFLSLSLAIAQFCQPKQMPFSCYIAMFMFNQEMHDSSFIHLRVCVFIRKVIHRTIYPLFIWLWRILYESAQQHNSSSASSFPCSFLHSLAYCIAFCLLAYRMWVSVCGREWRYLALLTVKAHTPHPSNCCWIIVCVYASWSVCAVFQQFSTAIKTATASPRDHKNRMGAMKNDKNIGREKSAVAELVANHWNMFIHVDRICEYVYVFTSSLNNSFSGAEGFFLKKKAKHWCGCGGWCRCRWWWWCCCWRMMRFFTRHPKESLFASQNGRDPKYRRSRKKSREEDDDEEEEEEGDERTQQWSEV